MSERQKATKFLKALIQCDNSEHCHELRERVKKAERDEKCIRSALFLVTVLGLQFGQLLGGAIITETVFAWPGVATLTVESIRNQDFPVVQCAVILLALLGLTACVVEAATPITLLQNWRPPSK
jgi:hypothetical protein